MTAIAVAELLALYASRCRRHERRHGPETDASRRDRWILAVLIDHSDELAALSPVDAPAPERKRLVRCASWETAP